MVVEHTERQSSFSDPSAQPLTYLAAIRLQQIRDHDLEPMVREKATLCLIDYLGALISGLSSPWSSSLLQWAKISCPGGGSAQVIGLPELVSAETAAFANASIAHRCVMSRHEQDPINEGRTVSFETICTCPLVLTLE